MGKKVITVDDSATLRKMVSFCIKGIGHEVFEAEDGAKGLDFLKANQVDLVITDLNMPNMNGIELTRQLRMLPQYKSVPILLLTTESDAAKKNEGRSAGATGWIVKPFNQEQLLAVVNKLLPQ